MRTKIYIDPESRLLADAATGGKVHLDDPRYHQRVGALVARIHYTAGPRGLEVVRLGLNHKAKLLERVGPGRRGSGDASELKRALDEIGGWLAEARACRESEARSGFMAEASPVIDQVADLLAGAGIMARDRFARVVTPELLTAVLERLGLGAAWLDRELRGVTLPEVNAGLKDLADRLVRLGGRKLADWGGHFYLLGSLAVYIEAQADRTGKGWYGYLVHRDPAAERRVQERAQIELVWSPGLEDVLDRAAPLAVGPARPLLPAGVFAAQDRGRARAS